MGTSPSADTAAGRRARGAWLAVLLVAAVWVGARAAWWVGWANGDDLIYANYAWRLDRLPADHREFRVLPELAMRAAMRLLGPNELAAAVPSLLASAATAAAVAVLLRWPRRRHGGRTLAMLVAVSVPLEVAMASYPGAAPVAAGLAALGSALLVRGGRRGRIAAGALLGLAFACHEIVLYWLLALGIALGLVDRRRRREVAVTLALALAVPVVIEAGVYAAVAGDPLLRWEAAAREVATTGERGLREFGGSLARFLLWPVQVVVVSKQFAFDFLLLAGLGAAAWRRLEVGQRALLLGAALYWLWMGYGTQVPWAWRPRTHDYHYFLIMTLPIGALLGPLLRTALPSRRARLAAGAVLATHAVALAGGGRWGQNVEVSAALLGYARAHPGRTFVTDVHTLNEMAALEGFVLPPNVTCVAADASLAWLYVNWGVAPERWQGRAVRRVDAALVNRERTIRRPDAAFVALLAARPRGNVLWERGPDVKPLFRPLVRWLGDRPFVLRNAGGEAVALPGRPPNLPPEGP